MATTSRGNGRSVGRGRGCGRPHRGNTAAHDDDEMNAHLSERVGRNPNPRTGRGANQGPRAPKAPVNQRIGTYLRKIPIGRGAPNWTLRPEIPSIEELMPYDSFPMVQAPSDAHWDRESANQSAKPPGKVAIGWDDSADFASWDSFIPKTKPAWDDTVSETAQEPSGATDDPAENDEDHSGPDQETSETQTWDVGATSKDAWDQTDPSTDPWSTKAGQTDPWEASNPAEPVEAGESQSEVREAVKQPNDVNGTMKADESHENARADDNDLQAVDKDVQVDDETAQVDDKDAQVDDKDAQQDVHTKEVTPEDTERESDDKKPDESSWNQETNEDPWTSQQTADDPWNNDNVTADPWLSEEKGKDTGNNPQTDDDPWTQNGDDAWNNDEANGDAWTQDGLRTDPAPSESQDNDFDESFDNVHNQIKGPWASKAEYLRNHYLLLREDAVRQLRTGLQYVRDNPSIVEDPSMGGIGIYDHVHVCGITFSGRGLGIRVRFSLGRIGKRVRWEQSSRLKSGSLVILMTPERSICKVATVAARTIENTYKDPPEIDLFLSRAEDVDIDCGQEWIMVEDRSAYFESQRYTLASLQRMSQESFPLQDHLVHVEQSVQPPEYLIKEPLRTLNDIYPIDMKPVNVLEAWPEAKTGLDESQMEALKTILTKKVALVQGPPGTGKTHVSVQALKVLVRNMNPGDPPIFVTCQTNHALDQLLRLVAQFEPAFVRIGGRSKDMEVVAKRTVHELKADYEHRPWKGARAFNELVGELSRLIAPLVKNDPNVKEVLDIGILEELGVLSQVQCESLVKGAAQWMSHGKTSSSNDPMMMWITESRLERVSVRRIPFLVSWEDDDDVEDETEDVQEADAETGIKGDDDEIERLHGEFFMIGDTWTSKGLENEVTRKRAKELLKTKQNLYDIRVAERPVVYRFLQRSLKRKISERLRTLWPKYQHAVEDRKIHNLETNEIVVRDQKIVGLTTTGVSKYRGLVAAMRPKVILIEEAAETMEAPVIAACVESLEHLILVGDHKQLRPHCNVSELEKPPYHLDISMFERLVDNGLDFSLLLRQRRMKPEIRRLIAPIYGDKIKDHGIVRAQPLISGMGGLSTWFFTHEQQEARDVDFSAFNPFEGDMIYGLVQYLIYNGIEPHEITILTFYRAQVRYITKKFKSFPNLSTVKVVTVDSYQGEENKVVMLSMVRSNDEDKIGFVGVENRICVALSRAKCGFYLFGNGRLLTSESKLWSQVFISLHNGSVGKQIKDKVDPDAINPHLLQRRVGHVLPLWCPKHRKMTFIKGVEDWTRNVGGCNLLCNGVLTCGHKCLELCHPWDHSKYQSCNRPCLKMMPCGHQCSLPCKEVPHACINCTKAQREAELAQHEANQISRPTKSKREPGNIIISPKQSTDIRMGRLLDEDFEGLNVGGDGYSYDGDGNPVLQGRAENVTSPRQHEKKPDEKLYEEIYGNAKLLRENLQQDDGDNESDSPEFYTRHTNPMDKDGKPLHPPRFAGKLPKDYIPEMSGALPASSAVDVPASAEEQQEEEEEYPHRRRFIGKQQQATPKREEPNAEPELTQADDATGDLIDLS